MLLYFVNVFFSCGVATFLGIILRNPQIFALGFYGFLFLGIFGPVCLLSSYFNFQVSEDENSILATISSIITAVPLPLIGAYTVIKYLYIPFVELAICFFLPRIVVLINKHIVKRIVSVKKLDSRASKYHYQINEATISKVKRNAERKESYK